MRGAAGSACLEGEWRKRFDWRKGARLEVLCQGDWWDAVVVNTENERIMIHYEGGGDDENEWILKSSNRLRPPESSSTDTSRSEGSLTSSKDFKTETNAEKCAESDGNDSGTHRPMRRSRMLSDDARLALQLQEEEVRAARETSSRKRSRPSNPPASRHSNPTSQHKVSTPAIEMALPPPTTETSQKASKLPSAKVQAPQTQKAKSVPDNARSIRSPIPTQTAASRSKETPVSSQSASSRPISGSSAIPSTFPKAQRKTSEAAHGMVSFIVIPDDSASADIPSLKRKCMSLTEETTVFHIKRTIVDEVMPGVEVSKIDIRTPSGLLLGQDHSLKYVRTFLWPPVKGDLVLKYSRSKTSLY